MKNIDNELIKWALGKIKNEYKDDVALLIGQKGACKIPTDEQSVAFDFFVPATKRGYNLSETFVIEDMGYDLFPMSWERLEGIVNLNEKITFAFAKGVILYARTKEDEERFLNLQKKLRENLENKKFTYEKSLEQINVAMDIFKTMVFDDDMSHVRKSAGGIVEYLSMALATFNGTFIGNTYGRMELMAEIEQMKAKPDKFTDICYEIVKSSDIDEIKKLSHRIIDVTRRFFMENKLVHSAEDRNYNYDDLASWYYEARYTFRRIAYYCSINDYMSAYDLGCYIQIEFDSIQGEFGLDRMDLLGYFKYDDLKEFAQKSAELEQYVLSVIKEKCHKLNIYSSLEEFLGRRG
ncbi:MAG: hypothetical protein Q4F66_13205 [Clostridium sp.]|nr:hypothetical protein [Clostridium sp.]